MMLYIIDMDEAGENNIFTTDLVWLDQLEIHFRRERGWTPQEGRTDILACKHTGLEKEICRAYAHNFPYYNAHLLCIKY